jgi:hypothetical protein
LPQKGDTRKAGKCICPEFGCPSIDNGVYILKSMLQQTKNGIAVKIAREIARSSLIQPFRGSHSLAASVIRQQDAKTAIKGEIWCWIFLCSSAVEIKDHSDLAPYLWPTFV